MKAIQAIAVLAVCGILVGSGQSAWSHTGHRWAHSRRAHADVASRIGSDPLWAFERYGFACGTADAKAGRDVSGSLASRGVAFDYIKQPAHRFLLAPGRALALCQYAQAAAKAQRASCLDAFLAGYKQGETAEGFEQSRLSGQSAGAPAGSGSAGSKSTPIVEYLDPSKDPSLTNLKWLGVAVKLYLADHNNTFPRMVNSTIADPYFQTYLVSMKPFYNPINHEPYKPNASLEYAHYEQYQKIERLVCYYEATPAPDGSRCVLFVDGSVARIQASEWKSVAKQSGIGITDHSN